jgi:hypothetical protein
MGLAIGVLCPNGLKERDMDRDDNDCVLVPPRAFEGLQRWIETGEANPSDIGTVLRWLRDGGWYAAADWVESNQQPFLDAIGRSGFRPEA